MDVLTYLLVLIYSKAHKVVCRHRHDNKLGPMGSRAAPPTHSSSYLSLTILIADPQIAQYGGHARA